ncbi:MAG: hypothetical protein ACLGIG_00065 [Actinomycetes bacterium]
MPDADLDAVARRLAAASAAVHRCARRLEATAAATPWQGDAADAFRAALADDVARVRGCAGSLEDAAAAVHAHAATVAERREALRALRDAALAGTGSVLDDLAGLAGSGVAELVGRAVR